MDSKAPQSGDAALAEALIPAALEAGAAIMKIRRTGFATERKSDLSPVTEADRAGERIILAHLARLAPAIPVIAEESVSAGRIPEVGADFFLVDPLDGTREFVRGGDDFTVNIGLVRNGEPVLGIIFVPACGELFVGVKGEGASTAKVEKTGAITSRQPIRVRHVPPGGPYRIVASKSHRTPETDAFIARYEVEKLVSAGSSLKFCLLAAGEADIYPRLGTTMQWDIAAGDAILRAAGGRTLTMQGEPFPYGPQAGEGGYRNPWFVALGGVEALA